VSRVPFGVDDDDLPVARRRDAVGDAVQRDRLARPGRADHERRPLQPRQRHEDAVAAVWQDAVHRDVASEFEGQVDRLRSPTRAERLVRPALGCHTSAFGATLVALAQLVDATALQQPDREREREAERRGVPPPSPDVRPCRLESV